MQYPLLPWWAFTVSGPTLPDFYWNVKSEEERIKKICEDLWKLIQITNLVTDAINDHENRISELESLKDQLQVLINNYNNLLKMIGDLNENVTNLQNQINEFTQNLPNEIRNIVNQITASEEFRETVVQIVEGLLDGKMNLVQNAVSGNIATFGENGQVIDSGLSPDDFEQSGSIQLAPNQYVFTNTGAPENRDAVMQTKNIIPFLAPNTGSLRPGVNMRAMAGQPVGVMNNEVNGIPSESMQPFTITIDGKQFTLISCTMIGKHWKNGYNHVVEGYGIGFNNDHPFLLYGRINVDTNDQFIYADQLTWTVVSNQAVESDEQNAQALSEQMPSTIVYTEEVQS